MRLLGGQLIDGRFTTYYLGPESLTLKEGSAAVYVSRLIGTSQVKLPKVSDCPGEFVLVFFLEAGRSSSPFETSAANVTIMTSTGEYILSAGVAVSTLTLNTDREMHLLFSDGQFWFPCASRTA